MIADSPSKTRWTTVNWIAGTLVLLIAAGGYQYVAKGSKPPQRQLELARKLRITNASQALALVRSSIQAAGGDFAEAQVFECLLLLDLRRRKEAASAFTALRHPEVTDPEGLCQLAEKAQSLGELELAGRIFIATADYIRSNPRRLKLLIHTLYSQENPVLEDQILKLCQDYTQLSPDDAYPWLVSAGLYHESNVLHLAIEAYRESLKRNPPPEEVIRIRFHLVRLSMMLGDLKAAREHCDTLHASTLDELSQKLLPILLADLLQREGKLAESLGVLDKLQHADSNLTAIRALRGKALFELMDYPGAIDELTNAVQLDDFDQQSHYLLGRALLQEKNETMATSHLNRSRELNELTAQIFTVENQLRNDLHNRKLKRLLADLNEQRGHTEKAAAWRRGAATNSHR